MRCRGTRASSTPGSPPLVQLVTSSETSSSAVSNEDRVMDPVGSLIGTDRILTRAALEGFTPYLAQRRVASLHLGPTLPSILPCEPVRQPDESLFVRLAAHELVADAFVLS